MQRCRWETARERGRKLVFRVPGAGQLSGARMGRALLAESCGVSATRSRMSAASSTRCWICRFGVLFAEEGSERRPLESNGRPIRSRHCLRWRWRCSVSWRSLGLEPDVLLGHSHRRDSGGACGWHFIAGRGRSGGGGAQPVAAGAERQAERDGGDGELQPRCCRCSSRRGVVGLSLAVVNTPRSTVVSGRRSGGAWRWRRLRRGRAVQPPGCRWTTRSHCATRWTRCWTEFRKVRSSDRARQAAGADGDDGDGARCEGTALEEL